MGEFINQLVAGRPHLVSSHSWGFETSKVGIMRPLLATCSLKKWNSMACAGGVMGYTIYIKGLTKTI